ncbi:GGDEF domain-containing protein [Thalassotalea sediminis]|uniref:GGDEF domain-containing protein n=1 Tax=Thalassotalea sediminis TaxID=1759089 RepID=UPI002573EAEA|nr:GGDEF domain-containing protein [Thalassotalea sediminis]
MTMALTQRISYFAIGCCFVFFVIIFSVLFAYQSISLATQQEAFAQRIESHTDVLKQIILSKQLFAKNNRTQEWITYHNQLQELIKTAPRMTAKQQVILNSIASRNLNLKALFEKQTPQQLDNANKILQNHFNARLLTQLESIRADAVNLSKDVQRNIKETVEQEFMLIAVVLLLSLSSLTLGAVKLKRVVKTSLNEVEEGIKNNVTDHFQQIDLTYPSEEFESIVTHFQEMNRKLEENSISIDAMQQIIAERTKILEEISRTDPLTKIANRRAIYERGALEFSRSKRANSSLTVMLFDCDFFKKVNDEYGHFCGDELLKHLCNICQLEIREVDFLGRYGGEEFVVILPACKIEDSKETAKRIQERLYQNPLTFRGQMIPITISIGMSTQNARHENFEQLLNEADQAMYQAKHKGRNRIEVFNTDTD